MNLTVITINLLAIGNLFLLSYHMVTVTLKVNRLS